MIEDIISFIQTNVYSALAVGILIILFFYRRPQIFIKIFLFLLIFGLTVYLVLGISGTAIVQKKNLLHKTDISQF